MKASKLLLILSVFFLTLKTFAQAPNWAWAKNGNCSGLAEAQGMATDVSGNVYICGAFFDTLIVGSYSFFSGGSNFSSFYLIKYSSTGSLLWVKSGKGNGYSVSTDANGNVIFVGQFFDSTITFGSYILTSPSGLGTFIVKYDSLGNVLWATSPNANNFSGNIIPYGITTDINNNIFVAGGYTNSSPTFGAYTLPYANSNNWNSFLVKYDSNGNVQWAECGVGNAAGVSAYAVATDNIGNAYITGNFNSTTGTFGTINLTSAYGNDYFLVKYDPLGNVIWARIDGGFGNEASYSITVNSQEKVFITGSFDQTFAIASTTLHTVMYQSNVMLIKYDTAGTPLWAKCSYVQMGGVTNACAYGVAADTSGNVYITGGTTSTAAMPNFIGFDTFQLNLPAVLDQMYLIKFDSLGNPLWGKVLSGGGDDDNQVAIDRFGDIFVGGDVFGFPVIVGSDTLVSSFNGEAPFVAKIGTHISPDNISHLDISFSSISIYPNPAINTISIEYKTKTKNCSLKIYNITGQVIYQSSINTPQYSIDVSHFASGIYLLKINDGEKNISKRFVKE